ncbi:hypothetical protein HYALB_00008724 [Hymenoscyphus albidus]|uniref:Uncharacterized protein n=1 Tax=Hymenoscyphus albidus TaxID=595503 RepID=A0A9N9LNJ8_9HELO|nr:hypothetical protein HYALB_00008724 [Hymenoscyphus albidus]
MKYSVIAALALAAPAIMASPTKEMVQKRSTVYTDKINVAEKLTGRPGSDLFNDQRVPNFVATELGKRQENNTFEPDPNRPIVTPPLIFVLQCTDAGFRGNCIVFGARPGRCGKSHSSQESCSDADVLKVDYDDFNPFNSTMISGIYNNNVSSLSTNTGGKCQFYQGDRPGVTLSYLFNLAVASEDPDYSAGYETLSARGAVKISYLGCNDKGDDRGLTSSYNYNLAVALEEDPRTVEYEDRITSWKC